MSLLQYDFRVVGSDRLNAALSAQRAQVRAHNRRLVQDAEEASGKAARVAGSRRATTDPALSRARQEERAAVATARARERAERAAIAATEREQRRVQKSSEASRLREERTVAAEQRRHQHYWASAQRRSEDERIRMSEVATAKARVLGRERFGRVAGVAAGTMGTLGTVARVGAGMAAIGGGFALAGSVTERLENTKRAANLAAQAGVPGEYRGILKGAENVKGFQTSEVLGGLERWTSLTGQLGAVTGENAERMQQWANLSDATSASIEDIAQAAGNLMVDFSAAIPDADKRMAAVTETMRAMAAQGAKGSVELKDLATMIGEVWAGASQFSGDPVRKMRQMGAIAQVIKPTAGSTAEAVTAIQRLPDDLSANAEKLKAHLGVDVWEKGKKGIRMREAPTILADLLEATGGRMDLLKKYGIDIRAARAIRPFSETHYEAEQRRKEGKLTLEETFQAAEGTKKGAGRAAVLARIGEFENETLTEQEETGRAGKRREAEDKHFMERMRELNRAVGTAALPQINQMGTELVKLVPTIAKTTGELLKFVNWAIANPWSGIGTLVGAALVKEIAGAAIGAAVRQSLTGFLTPAATSAAGSLTAVGTSGWAAHAALGRLALIGGAITSVMAAADQFKKLWAETHGGKTPEQENEEAQKEYIANAATPDERAKRISQVLANNQKAGPGAMTDLLAATAPGGSVLAPYTSLIPKSKGPSRDVFEAVKSSVEFGTATSRMTEEEAEIRGGGRATSRVNVDATGASEQLEQAATKINAAADKLTRNIGLNRGDKPSPVWPG